LASTERAADRPPPPIVVAGPTASGKSTLALRLAETLVGVVINADALQLYRDLAILTARPDAAALARAPHRLYGILDAAERSSAAAWRRLALAEIAAAQAAGLRPILVGGSGLYLRALTEGLAPVPPVPAAIRAATQARRAALGAAAFHAELATQDPVMAARLAPGDTQRVLRAAEVIAATGRSLAEWWRETDPDAAGVAVLPIVLLPPRPALHAAIAGRLRAMLDAGVLEEVRSLEARGLDPALPVFRALGYRAFAEALAGGSGLDRALDAAALATRQYAKRQITWFRHQMQGAHGWDAQFSESLGREIISFIRKCS